MNKCVYLHIDGGGLVRYVGSGTIERANRRTAKSNRGKLYEEFVLANGKLEVEIIARNLSKIDAENLERELYDKYKETILNYRKPSSEQLMSKVMFQDYLFYDETSITGLRWKVDGSGKGGGNIRKDAPAGTLKRGYYITGLNSREYRNHRIIALLHDMDISGKVIDHIDRNTLNNKINNLRVVTQQENAYNRSQQLNNISGATGVNWHKLSGCWVAQWKENKKNCVRYFLLSDYDSPDDAFRAAVEYRERMVDLHYKI